MDLTPNAPGRLPKAGGGRRGICDRQPFWDAAQPGNYGLSGGEGYSSGLAAQWDSSGRIRQMTNYFALQPSYEVEGRILAQYAAGRLGWRGLLLSRWMTSMDVKVICPDF